MKSLWESEAQQVRELESWFSEKDLVVVVLVAVQDHHSQLFGNFEMVDLIADGLQVALLG